MEEQIHVLEAQQVTNSQDDPSTKVTDGNDASEAQSVISLKGVEGTRSEAEMKDRGTSVKLNNHVGGRPLMTTAGQTRESTAYYSEFIAVVNLPERRVQLKLTCTVVKGRSSLAAIGNVGKDKKGAAEPSRAQQTLVRVKSQVPSGHVQR